MLCQGWIWRNLVFRIWFLLILSIPHSFIREAVLWHFIAAGGERVGTFRLSADRCKGKKTFSLNGCLWRKEKPLPRHGPDDIFLKTGFIQRASQRRDILIKSRWGRFRTKPTPYIVIELLMCNKLPYIINEKFQTQWCGCADNRRVAPAGNSFFIRFKYQKTVKSDFSAQSILHQWKK